jgi:hypothetical protein
VKPETDQLAQFAACCCLAEYRPAPAAAARRTPVDLPSRPLIEPSFARRVRLALEAAGDATIVTVALFAHAAIGRGRRGRHLPRAVRLRR